MDRNLRDSGRNTDSIVGHNAGSRADMLYEQAVSNRRQYFNQQEDKKDLVDHLGQKSETIPLLQFDVKPSGETEQLTEEQRLEEHINNLEKKETELKEDIKNESDETNKTDKQTILNNIKGDISHEKVQEHVRYGRQDSSNLNRSSTHHEPNYQIAYHHNDMVSNGWLHKPIFKNKSNFTIVGITTNA